MDNKQLTALFTKHEGRIARVEQRTSDLQKAFTKHTNRHFQVTLLIGLQLLVTIGGLVAILLKLPHPA